MAEIEIVFEPPPKPLVKEGKKKDWTRALSSLKAAPGAHARIMRIDTRSTADYYVRTIRKSLEEKDPHGLWEIKSHKMEDRQGGFGVWACYKGQMTPEEYDRKMMERKQHAERMRKAYAKKKLLKQLHEDPLVTRPNLLAR
jgi:hypothetical protein